MINVNVYYPFVRQWQKGLITVMKPACCCLNLLYFYWEVSTRDAIMTMRLIIEVYAHHNHIGPPLLILKPKPLKQNTPYVATVYLITIMILNLGLEQHALH